MAPPSRWLACGQERQAILWAYIPGDGKPPALDEAYSGILRPLSRLAACSASTEWRKASRGTGHRAVVTWCHLRRASTRFLLTLAGCRTPRACFKGFSGAETDISKQYALGVNISAMARVSDPPRTSPRALDGLKDLVDRTPKPKLLGPALRQRGYDKLGLDHRDSACRQGHVAR